MRFQRSNYFEAYQPSVPLGLPLQSDNCSSLLLNSPTSYSNPQSSDDLSRGDTKSPLDSLEDSDKRDTKTPADSLEDSDRGDAKTPSDSLEDSEYVSSSPVQEFVCVDKYESPYLEESACRISSFCMQNEDVNSNHELSDEDVCVSSGNYRLHVRSPLLGYMDSMEESTTLPPIYELEGEGSEITELASSPRSSQFLSTECLHGASEKPETHAQHPQKQVCSDSCAQYCSNNDSIMTYYPVVPPEEGRESVRNVDHLVDRLDVKQAQGCPSPSSPFPLTPPNTCDSSPKLSNIKAPTRNNLHALSGVEVKY